MIHHGRYRAIGAIVLGTLTLLSGCGGLRLHSEVRDKQGVAAKEAWTSVDLGALIATERANLKKLLDAELDAQDRLAEGIQNHELRYIVGGASVQAALVDPVAARLADLAGTAANVQASRARLTAFRARSIRLDAVKEELDAHKLAMPSCDALAAGEIPPAIAVWQKTASPVSIAEVEGSLKQLRKECAKPENDLVASVYSGLTGPVFKDAIDRYQADLAALNKAKEDASALRTAYQVALAAYKAALGEAPSDPTATEKTRKALENLNLAVAALARAPDAFSIRYLSKERIDALDEFVSVVTESTPQTVPEGANKATLAFVLLPALVDDARQSLAEARKPLALPLLIRRNHEALKLEAATREIEIREAMLRLSRELVEALYAQAVQLWLASRELDAAEVKPLHATKVLEAFSSSQGTAKELLYTAAARYLDCVNRHAARRYRLEYMRIAASHELGLAYAEVNVKQWQSLIGASVDQVAAYGAGGIKPEQINGLLNTLGVFWIGNGVNK